MSSDALQVVGAALAIAGAPLTGGASLALQFSGAALLYTGARLAAKEAEQEAKRRAREAANSRSIKSNVRGSSEVHFVCFGKVRAGGIVCVFGTQQSEGQLFIGLAHSLTHPGGAEGIEAIWVNDYKIPTTSIVNNAVTDPRFVASDGTNMITYRRYLGTSTQTADSGIVGLSNVAGNGSTAHRRGIAWTLFILEKPADDPEGFAEAFPNGMPILSVEFKGNKCYDPRLDSNNGGSGSHRYASPTTWAWTQNSALIAATYMIMEVSDGGMGYDPAADIDWPSVAAAANICDETVTNGAGSPTVSQARYTCNLALDTQDSRETNLQKILDTMMGVRVRVGGKYKIHAGAYDSPTFEFDESYLRGPIRVSTRSPLEQLYNAVRITHDDAEQNYLQVEAPPFTSSTYEAQDGGERIWREEARPGITNAYQAQYVATVLGQQSRTQKVIEAPCNLKALNLEVWETGTVTLDELGIEGVYRLVSWEWENDGPRLTLREETAESWEVDTYVAAVAPTTPTINTETPPTPAGLTATAVYDGIALRWTSPEPPSASTSRIDVYRAGTGSPSTYAKIGSTSGLFYHDPLTDGLTYSYLLKSVNYQGVASAFSAGAQATARTIPEVTTTGSGVAVYDQLDSATNTHLFFNVAASRGIEIAQDDGVVSIEAGTAELDHLALSSDSSSTSTTLADVTNFKFTDLEENSLYVVKLKGLVQTAATTTGFKIGATASGASSMQLLAIVPGVDTSSSQQLFGTGTTSVSVTSANMPAANTTYPFTATFMVKTGADSASPTSGLVGSFQIQFATEVGSSSATLKANSLLVLEKVKNMTASVTLTLQAPGFAANYTSSDSGSGSVSARLTLTCKTDGTWTIAGEGDDAVTGTPLSGNWATPTTAGAGSSYEVKFVATDNGIGTASNDAPDWTAITANRIYRYTVTSAGPEKIGTATVQMIVRQIGTTTPTSDGTTAWTVTAEGGSS